MFTQFSMIHVTI